MWNLLHKRLRYSPRLHSKTGAKRQHQRMSGKSKAVYETTPTASIIRTPIIDTEQLRGEKGTGASNTLSYDTEAHITGDRDVSLRDFVRLNLFSAGD